MDVNRVELDRRKLTAMPKPERVLLLLLAHASNEINVLIKLILMMRKDDPPSQIHDHVETGQMFILIRLLIGKLHEAWDLFIKRCQKNPAIAKKYRRRLSPDANTALNSLKRHFGRGSPLSAIRNKISFHYSDKENLTEKNFQQLAESEPLLFYLSKTVGNSFYHAGELVAQSTTINLRTAPAAGPNDDRSPEARAFNALCSDVIAVSRDITELFGDLIGILSKDACGQITIEQIADGPKLSTFSLPYFFNENDALPHRADHRDG